MSTLKSPAVSESLAPGRCVPTPAAAGVDLPFPECPDLISNSDQYCTSKKLPLARGDSFGVQLLPFEMMTRDELTLMHGSTESESILLTTKVFAHSIFFDLHESILNLLNL